MPQATKSCDFAHGPLQGDSESIEIFRQLSARDSLRSTIIDDVEGRYPLMSHRSAPRSSFLLLATFIFAGGLAVCWHAQGQVIGEDQEIFVHNLPSVTAHSQDSSGILLASLETVFHDEDVCCGKNSALLELAQAADAGSLKDVAGKLDGRHLLSDGRPVTVQAVYVPTDAISGGPLIAMVMKEHAALIKWNSHLYVLHGVVYRWMENGDSTTGSKTTTTVIHKLLLWDARFSDSRRDVVFDRTKDDLRTLQGLLFLQSAPQ